MSTTEKPLSVPMQIVLVRMISPEWHDVMKQSGIGWWYPVGQQRFILHALSARGLIDHTESGPFRLFLTEDGIRRATELIAAGVTIDG